VNTISEVYFRQWRAFSSSEIEDWRSRPVASHKAGGVFVESSPLRLAMTAGGLIAPRRAGARKLRR